MITYGEAQWNRAGEFGQDILFNGEVVGALITRDKGLLSPLEEIWQKNVEDNEANREYAHCACEDEGRIFAQFTSLENFLTYLEVSHEQTYRNI